MRTTTLALAILAGLALSGCRIKGDPTYDAASSTCAPVASGCSDHSQCCSYACVHGTCIANATQGGICRTSDDCNYTLTCVSGRCQPGYACQPSFGDTCTSNNECCSGNCLLENSSVYPPSPGSCGDEHPPVLADLGGPYVVPYFVSTVLHAAATDLDTEDVLYYAWDVLSAPAGAPEIGWTATGATPSFRPSVKGQYQLRVRVADGAPSQRNRATVSDTMVLDARNLPPLVEADPTHLPSTALRHTQVRLAGTVADPNGTATPVSCAWYAKPFNQAEIAAPIASFPSCPANPTTTYATPIDGPEGVWEFRLEAFDGEFTTSSVQRVDFVNGVPVAQACAYECASPPTGGVAGIRAGNLGPTPGTTPSIPLHGSATDPNKGPDAVSDVGQTLFTWEWRLESAPVGSARSAGLVLGASTDAGVHAPPFDGSLDPDVAGTYVVRLHVADGWGATNDATVAVRVDPYLRPLHPLDMGTGLPFGGDVADAVYAHATDRLSFIGTEESSAAQRLWLLDPEASPTTAIPYAGLARTAVVLGLDPGGTTGIVGEVSGFERVSVSGAPSASSSTVLSFTPTEVLDAGQREYALSPSGQIYDISSANSVPEPVTCSTGTCVGTRGTSTTDTLWLLDEAAGIMRRYDVQPNGRLDQSPAGGVSGLSTSADLWLSALYGSGSSRDVVVAAGTRYEAGTLAPAPPALPIALRHLDTIAVGTDIRGVAVAATGTEVRTVGAAWSTPAANALALPLVGYQGTGFPANARYAFVRADGSKTYVVVRALIGGKYRWFLARY